MDELSACLDLKSITFEEASKFFDEKLPMTMDEFYSLPDKYRVLAFAVSGYAKVQVIKKFQDELSRAIADGATGETFRKNMNEFLDRQGYTGITPYQADNIFRTNVQTAYQVGHFEQMSTPMVKKLRPYWQYDAVNDRHTRPSHMAMDGKIFSADSPVWNTWYPPNGFRCRCSVNSLSQADIERRGLSIESDDFGQAVTPDVNFATNPAKTRFEPDLNGYPDTLKKAYDNIQKVASDK